MISQLENGKYEITGSARFKDKTGKASQIISCEDIPGDLLNKHLANKETELKTEALNKISWGTRPIVTIGDLLDFYYMDFITQPKRIIRYPKSVSEFQYFRNTLAFPENTEINDREGIISALNLLKKRSIGIYNRCISLFRKACSLAGTKDITKDIEHSKEPDFQYDTWVKTQQLILDKCSLKLKTFINFISTVPNPALDKLLKSKKDTTKLIGRLLYHGDNTTDFIPVPDNVSVADIFPENTNTLFGLTLENVEIEWNKICHEINIELSLSNFNRFASRKLVGEGFPRSLLQRKMDFSFFNAWENLGSLTTYSISETLETKKLWQNTLRFLKYRFKYRCPTFDAYKIKYGLFGRTNSTLDIVKTLDTAAVVAGLLLLSNCKSFSGIKQTAVRLDGVIHDMTEFKATDFGIGNNFFKGDSDE